MCVNEPKRPIGTAEAVIDAVPHPDRSPIITLRHIDNAYIPGDLASPDTPDRPVGVIDLDGALVDQARNEGDMTVVHPAGAVEYQDGAFLGALAAIIMPQGGVPPLPGITG